MEFASMMDHDDKSKTPLFYAFDLDDLVPHDHLLRKIDRFINLTDLRQHLAPTFCDTNGSSQQPKRTWPRSDASSNQ